MGTRFCLIDKNGLERSYQLKSCWLRGQQGVFGQILSFWMMIRNIDNDNSQSECVLKEGIKSSPYLTVCFHDIYPFVKTRKYLWNTIRPQPPHPYSKGYWIFRICLCLDKSQTLSVLAENGHFPVAESDRNCQKAHLQIKTTIWALNQVSMTFRSEVPTRTTLISNNHYGPKNKFISLRRYFGRSLNLQ